MEIRRTSYRSCPQTAAACLNISLLTVFLLTVFLLSGCSRSGFQDSEITSSDQSKGGLEHISRKEKLDTGKGGASRASYVLPDAQTRIYSEKELILLSDEELRIARNEIYARHGRRFQDEALTEYFSKKDWYHPNVSAEDFDESVFNDMERGNLKQILFAEEKRTPLSFPDVTKENFPKIDGSTATLPISQALYRLATGANQSEAEEKISHSRTTAAYSALLGEYEYKEVPSLVIAYAPDEEKLSELLLPDSPIEIKPIGRDALVFMTNTQNPVRSLSQKEITDIYAGKITNWKECGGPDRSIQAFQRPEGSGSQNLMEKLVMRGSKMAAAPQSKVFSEMGEILDALSSYDNAENSIGYSVYYYARNMYERPQLSFVSVDGIAPSNETIRSKRYPYTNDFYAAIRREEPADSAARKLYDWLTLDDGQALLSELGYVGETEHYRKMPDFLTEKAFIQDQAENDTATEQAKEAEREQAAEDHQTDAKPTEFVYIADGELFWGEQGTLILDGNLRYLDFLPDMVTVGMKPLEKQEISRPLLLYDMAKVDPDFNVPKRLYRINKKTWENFSEEQAVKQNEQTGEGEEQPDAGEDSFFAAYYPDPEQFARRYPDILKKYNVTNPEEIVPWQSHSEIDTTPAAYVFFEGENLYAYDASGRPIAEINMQELEEELRESGFDLTLEHDRKTRLLIYLNPPRRLNDHKTFLTVGYGGGGSTQFLHYYQNGKEIRKAKIKPRDNASYIVCAGDGFYLEHSENYLSVYSLDGTLLKRFLDGWMQND